MPKKKSGKRKKAEKVKANKAKGTKVPDLSSFPCNMDIKCEKCERNHRNRAFCYFCGTIPRLPVCACCGRQKCMSASGADCLVKHKGEFVTGMRFIGAICDFCEAWVCHSRRCITSHSCPCPLDGALCIECNRGITNNGGRFFRCATCSGWLCEDDQFEHQASCTYLESEDYQCNSCNRFGIWACLNCKICYCDLHYKGNIPGGVKCKKCQMDLKVTKDLSISARAYKFGRKSKTETKKAEKKGEETKDNETKGHGNDSEESEDDDNEEENDDGTTDEDRYAAFMNRGNTGGDYLNLGSLTISSSYHDNYDNEYDEQQEPADQSNQNAIRQEEKRDAKEQEGEKEDSGNQNRKDETEQSVFSSHFQPYDEYEKQRKKKFPHG